MAILIESIPGINKTAKVTFSDNHNIYTFSEDTFSLNANTTEFFFTVEVFINGASYSTHKVVPEQTYNDGTLKSWGKFDMQQILSNIVGINQRTTQIATQANNVKFNIKVGAEYINAGTPATIAQVTGAETLAIKGRLNNRDFVDFLYNNKYNTTALLAANDWQFFTNFPRTGKYYVNKNVHDVYLHAGFYNCEFNKIYFKLYTTAGTLIASATHTFTKINNAILINAAPKYIISETTIVDADFDTCAYYTVQTEDDINIYESEEFTFYVDRDCSVYDDVRLYFLETTGNIGAHTFRMLSRENTTVENFNMHKQIWGVWADDEYTFSLERGEEVGVMSYATTRLLLNSDWIEEATQNWLAANLYISPWVLMERGGVYERTNILTRGGEQKKRVNDKLFNEVVEVKLSNTITSQLT